MVYTKEYKRVRVTTLGQSLPVFKHLLMTPNPHPHPLVQYYTPLPSLH